MSCDIGRGEPKLRVSGGDPRFGGFDVLGSGGLLSPEALGFALRVGCGVLELRRLRFRCGLFGARLLELGSEGNARLLHRGARSGKQGQCDKERRDAAHPAILRGDRDGSQGSMWHETAARRASPGRADAARSPARTKATLRRRSSRPHRGHRAPPMRNRASRFPSSRHRSSLLASCPMTAPSRARRGRSLTLLDGSAGTFPPLLESP